MKGILYCWNWQCDKVCQISGKCEDYDIRFLNKECDFIWTDKKPPKKEYR